MILLHSLCDWLAEQVSFFFNFLNFFSGERSDREERSQSDREERGKRASGGGSVIFFFGLLPLRATCICLYSPEKRKILGLLFRRPCDWLR